MALNVREMPHKTIADFCERWEIQELALFGSALGEEFTDSSDIDLLVTFEDNARRGLLDHVQIQNELEQLFGREVDLISKRAVDQSHNWIRRKNILDSAQIIFSAEEVAYTA